MLFRSIVKQIERMNIFKPDSQRIKILRCLKRRKSKSQKKLSKAEREKNLKGRIFLCKDKIPLPETVLIIDDVITTGWTLKICADVIKEGGAENIYGLCLFYN